MIPTNDLRNFAKYKFIRAFRPDGAVLIATRIDGDIRIYVRWDIEENDPKIFKPLVLNSEGPYSTSNMIKKAQENGYGEWHPLPEDAEPDTTNYLVD